ncbi:MAG: PaaI family thioesterase [bacterium]
MDARSPQDSHDSWMETGAWNRHLGLHLTEVSGERVVGEWQVDARHHQPYGIVHGGVHCSVIETVCSIGAAMSVFGEGLSVVGLENHTSFVRATRDGRLSVIATPITRGRRSQLWEAVIRNESNQVVATGRVRLLCLTPGSELAGREVKVDAG